MSTSPTHIIQEIMDNPQFASWVKSDFKEDASYWSQWKIENPDQTTDLELAIQIFQSLQEHSIHSTDKLWQRIDFSVNRNVKTQKSAKISRLSLMIALAAMLLIFFGTQHLFLNTTKIVAGTTLVSHILPDGSQVILNKESQISYNKKSFLTERTLNLKGEAYFEVIKGNPFVVLTEKGRVQVLGTSFNVFNRGSKFEVACTSGSVGVTPYSSPVQQVLHPGDRIKSVDNKNYTINSGNSEPLWTSGSYYYSEQELVLVLEELARQYQLSLEVKANIKGRKYSGVFTDSNIKNAIYSVCWPMNLDCQVINSKLIIADK